ncbi:unnamed protein product [Alternaria alternata]
MSAFEVCAAMPPGYWGRVVWHKFECRMIPQRRLDASATRLKLWPTPLPDISCILMWNVKSPYDLSPARTWSLRRISASSGWPFIAASGDAANADTGLTRSFLFPTSPGDLACIMCSDLETEETAELSVLIQRKYF